MITCKSLSSAKWTRHICRLPDLTKQFSSIFSVIIILIFFYCSFIKKFSFFHVKRPYFKQFSSSHTIFHFPFIFLEAFEALLSSQDQTSVALASFNLAKNGKALRIQLWYNGSHGLGKSEDVIKVYN